ncbi:MAG: glycoside hydrolase family protein [Maricaulaceae bacterium]
MTPRLTISRDGLAFIKGFEGLRRKAARLADGRYVVGYGHTRHARADLEVSEKEAEGLLIYDLAPIQDLINDAIYAPLNVHQFDALCSLALNIGADNFLQCEVLSRLNEGRPIEAAAAFDVWRRARLGDREIIVDGLVRRRAAERALFLRPVDGPIAAPTPELPPRRDELATDLLIREAALHVPIDLNAASNTLGEPEPVEPPQGASLIASNRPLNVAAAQVSERLAKIGAEALEAAESLDDAANDRSEDVSVETEDTPDAAPDVVPEAPSEALSEAPSEAFAESGLSETEDTVVEAADDDAAAGDAVAAADDAGELADEDASQPGAETEPPPVTRPIQVVFDPPAEEATASMTGEDDLEAAPLGARATLITWLTIFIAGLGGLGVGVWTTRAMWTDGQGAQTWLDWVSGPGLIILCILVVAVAGYIVFTQSGGDADGAPAEPETDLTEEAERAEPR